MILDWKKNENEDFPIEDKSFFEEMINSSTASEKEREFFYEFWKRETTMFTVCGEMFLRHDENDEGIRIERFYYSEYEIGKLLKGEPPTILESAERQIYRAPIRIFGHFDDLHSLMCANAKEIGLLEDDITVLDWLRRTNFQGISYNRYSYD